MVSLINLQKTNLCGFHLQVLQKIQEELKARTMDLRTAEETKRRLLSEKASLEEKVKVLEKKKSNEVCCLNVFVFSMHSIFVLIFLFDCTDFLKYRWKISRKILKKNARG